MSAAGIANWEDAAYEKGYSVQLYQDGSAEGAPVILDANTTTYNFLSAMKTGGAAVYTVTVKAIGDGITYIDGPESKASNGIRLMEKVSSGYWTGYVAHWENVGAESYEVQLYRNGTYVTSKEVLFENTTAGANFTDNIVNGEDGTYGFKVIAKGDGVTQADADISDMLANFAKETTADITPTMTSPAVGGDNTIIGGGADKTVTVKVAAGTTLVKLEGAKAESQTIEVGGTDASSVTWYGTVTSFDYRVDTSAIAATGGSKVFTLKINETGKISIVYNITVTVAAPAAGSLTVSGADDDNSNDMTVIKVTEVTEAGNELVYKNFGGGAAVLPMLDEVVEAGWTLLPGDGIIPAADGDSIVVVERETVTNKAKKAGKTAAVVQVEIPDTTAPEFIEGYPTTSIPGTSSLILFSKIDEAGTVYYVVYEGGAAAPTAEILKAEGTAVSVQDTIEVSIEIIGLQADTNYDIYVVAEDKKGNLQADIKKVSVRTAK